MHITLALHCPAYVIMLALHSTLCHTTLSALCTYFALQFALDLQLLQFDITTIRTTDLHDCRGKHYTSGPLGHMQIAVILTDISLNRV